MNPNTVESHNYFSVSELNTPQWDRLWEKHMHEHPVLAHVVQTGDHHARRVSDFLSQRQFRDTGLHAEIYRHWDIHDVLCVEIPCRPPWITGVALHSDHTFNERERQLADLVRPHMSQAWQNAKLVARTRHRLEMLGLGMENLSAGIILCGAVGRVQFINAQARRYLAQYTDAKRQTDYHLPDDLLRWLQAQQLPENNIDEAPPVRMPLVLEREGKRLVVRLLSQPGANLILMEEQMTVPDTCALASFGLTARETEVLSWIARGKTNHEISIILDAHTATVKKHVEHILVKLGVETRTAAAAMALGGSQPVNIR